MIVVMTAAKIAITMNPQHLRKVDVLVRGRRFESLSHAIQSAVSEKIGELSKNRLARVCAKLNPRDEKEWAELGLTEDLNSWPKY